MPSQLEQDLKFFTNELKKVAAAIPHKPNSAFIARAPGRLDVMGGVGDYSGSLVLETTIGAGTWAGLIPRPDNLVKIASKADGFTEEKRVEYPLESLVIKSPQDYSRIHEYLHHSRDDSWAAYAAGCVSVLSAKTGRSPAKGFDLILRSDVPIGAGVSSSAAIEVASMMTITEYAEVKLEAETLSAYCQEVENYIAGAPCGIMDQMTSALGKRRQFFKLRCIPHTVEGYLKIPDGIDFFGIDSAVKHSVGGGQYGKARIGAFMALGILQKEGVLPEGGYLCSLTPDQFRQVIHAIPLRMKGAEYMDKIGKYPDKATQPDPVTVYRPRSAGEHAVLENRRVETFIRMIESYAGKPSTFVKAGELMYASHWSYSHRIALGSPETDLLVGLLRQEGVASGIYGAKITGGGCGGTVAVMANTNLDTIEKKILVPYRRKTGLEPRLILGSSPGAYEFGVRAVKLH